MQVVIEIARRYPTAKLAEWEIQFLPACSWQVTERSGWFYLQFECERDKAHRILSYLRRDFASLKFEERELPEAQL